MTDQSIDWKYRLHQSAYWKRALLALLFGFFYFCLGFAALSTFLNSVTGLTSFIMDGMIIDGILGMLLTPFMLAISAVSVAVLSAVPFIAASPVLLVLLVVLQLGRREVLYAGTMLGLLLILPTMWLVSQFEGGFYLPTPFGSIGGGFMLGYAAWQERFRKLP